MKRWDSMMTAVLVSLATTSSVLAQAPPSPPRPAAAPAPASTTATVIRVGFVDVQRVLTRSTAGVSARDQLEREKATMQKEMEAKRQELDKLRDELEKKGPLMTADTRRDKTDAYERKRRDAARLVDDFQKELEKKEQTLLHRVLQDLGGIIERVAKDRGYALIVERRGLLYASAEADVTDDVIRAYDQESASKGKK
jgi:outer membrane protein